MKSLAVALTLGVVVALGLAYPETWLSGHDPTGSRVQIEGLSGPVSILRDSAGFPLIQAQNERDAFVGLGFAMATDRAFQIEERVRAAQNRSSELEELASAIDPQLRARLDAFAAGGNGYLARAGAFPTPEHRLLLERARLWRSGDALRVLQALVAQPLPERAPCARTSWTGCGGHGSFVVDAGHSASHAPLLSATVTGTIDELPSFWYAAQLSTPKGYLQGLFFPGVPLAITGRDASGAWTTESWLAETETAPDVAAWAGGIFELEQAATPEARTDSLRRFEASGLGTGVVVVDAAGARRLLFDVDQNRTLVTRAARSGVLAIGQGRYAARLTRSLEDGSLVTATTLERLARDLVHGGANLGEAEIAKAFSSEDPDTVQIRSVLTSWDGRCERGSRGCALFESTFARWRVAQDTAPQAAASRAALRDAALASLQDLKRHSGDDPDGWNLGSLQHLQMLSPAARVPILGRWFRRGPFAFEGCSTCALAAWGPPSEGVDRRVTVGTSARFAVDLSRPGRSQIALPTASSENPFRASGQPITDAWLAGSLHSLSIDPGGFPHQDPVRLLPGPP